eukprot:GHVS01023247.1.p1 GENE.GHVS01023247.1~~GHVS01023247.1.p1  ORF type:complete len:364 (+),score=38.09 GHVS01023247.1:223-1314(+)
MLKCLSAWPRASLLKTLEKALLLSAAAQHDSKIIIAILGDVAVCVIAFPCCKLPSLVGNKKGRHHSSRTYLCVCTQFVFLRLCCVGVSSYPTSNLSELLPSPTASAAPAADTSSSVSSTSPDAALVPLTASISVNYSKSPVYATEPFAGSYCFPIDSKDTDNIIEQLKLGSIWMYASRSVEAAGRHWYWLIAGGAMGALLALIYLVLLKFAARGVVWAVLVITPIVLLAAGIFLAYMSFSHTSHSVVDSMNERLRGWTGYVGVAIAVTGVLMAVGVFLLRSSINTAVCVMQAALECFQSLPKIAVYPVICMVLMSCVLGGGLWILSYLFTANEFKPIHTLHLGQGENGLNSLDISGIHRWDSI